MLASLLRPTFCVPRPTTGETNSATADVATTYGALTCCANTFVSNLAIFCTSITGGGARFAPGHVAAHEHTLFKRTQP